jgi:hypothetical protein
MGPTGQSTVCRGQWEKRLQTDINLAKQALSEALSFDPKSIELVPNTTTSTSNGENSTTTQSSPFYALTTDNISKLLEQWNNKSTKSNSVSSSSSTETSVSGSNGVMSPQPIDSVGLGLNFSGPELSMLESWLLDESTDQDQAQFYDMSLDFDL